MPQKDLAEFLNSLKIQFGPILDRFWTNFGPIWKMDRFWTNFGTIWTKFGQFWAIFECFGPILADSGPFWRIKGPTHGIIRSDRPSGGAVPLRRPKRSLNTHPQEAWRVVGDVLVA